MSLLKKTLLFVIAIQVLVLVQLSVVKYGNQKNHFNTLYNTLTFKTPPPIKPTPTPAPLTEEEQILADAIKRTINEKITRFEKSTKQDSHLTLLCSHDKSKNIRQKVALYAKKLLGHRYVWGATGPNSFDCSGFTQKVYKKAGISIPRISQEQAKVGTYIQYQNLQRGDMVFFDTKRQRTGKVTHVGIYLTDGKFIHASSGKRKVVITNFNKKIFYKNRFLWGRRIINNRKKRTLQTFSNVDVMNFFNQSKLRRT